MQNKTPQLLSYQGFAAFWQLLELDRPRRLASAVVEHAVDALDLVDDAARDLLQDVPRERRTLGGHEVAREDGSERDGMVVRPAVAHDADASHIRERGEVLAEGLVDASSGDLFAIDGIGLLDDLDLLRRDEIVTLHDFLIMSVDAHTHLVEHAVRFECRRASARDTSPFGVPQLGIDGQFATELRLAAVHRDASHDGYCPVLFHYLTFEVVDY